MADLGMKPCAEPLRRKQKVTDEVTDRPRTFQLSSLPEFTVIKSIPGEHPEFKLEQSSGPPIRVQPKQVNCGTGSDAQNQNHPAMGIGFNSQKLPVIGEGECVSFGNKKDEKKTDEDKQDDQAKSNMAAERPKTLPLDNPHNDLITFGEETGHPTTFKKLPAPPKTIPEENKDGEENWEKEGNWGDKADGPEKNTDEEKKDQVLPKRQINVLELTGKHKLVLNLGDNRSKTMEISTHAVQSGEFFEKLHFFITLIEKI